ncbi:deoxyguanosinetriphosphate triphosphohydrolase [Fusibacter sp. 3D3]|uniref:deoxyguanosinetriphosphate triphosphohydrolase n=1 Tax=Fusibacter sp. 3D3 TaxID=1048380 RepID=UPI0008538080|nr:deoxyguanosinetriphosphate triphosphohydrolase [Fusibacter sp. 3D3]
MIKFREEHEKLEYVQLDSKAQKVSDSKGRRLEEEQCPIRTDYQRDRDRITHSKAFRRLKHKTQVFLSPEGDHYRTRLTHTLEVSQISRTIAGALNFNLDLTEAIALGHDLGHTPFGHCGEERLNKIHPSGFKHNEQSLRVVDFLERRNNSTFGLNLTSEVRDGILNHNGPNLPMTLEGQIVKICDRIAYLNHDIDDAIRAGVLKESEIPKEFLLSLGETHGKRINTLIMDLIENSYGKEIISMSAEKQEAFTRLRKFMFEHVYLNKEAKKEEARAESIVESLYNYYLQNPDKMPEERFEDYHKSEGIEAIKDYVASMSDRYAVNIYKEIFIPKFWLY